MKMIFSYYVSLIATIIFAIVQWHRKRTMTNWHVNLIGLSGLTFAGLICYGFFTDPGDIFVYALFLALGILIAQPLLVRALTK